MLAREAGFPEDECGIIAGASAMTDSLTTGFRIAGNGIAVTVEPTQSWTFWRDDEDMHTWKPFHFMPGDPAKAAPRRDSARHPGVCTANSSRAKEVLVSALRTRNPYRIGIGLHVFADSWAHQNFVGARDRHNRRGGPIPPVGHAQFGAEPDDFNAEWVDSRLEPPHDRVTNRHRFMDAARLIYKYLATFRRRPFEDWPLVETGLLVALDLDGSGSEDRESRIAGLTVAYDVPGWTYNEWLTESVLVDEGMRSRLSTPAAGTRLWASEELQQSVGRPPLVLQPAPDFGESHMAAFLDAASEHRKVALEAIRNPA